MSDIAFNVPINGVSFGQTSINILREIRNRGLEPFIFPIGGSLDLGCEPDGEELQEWLVPLLKNSGKKYNKDIPIIKLWHLNGGLESFGRKQALITFYELDSPTEEELNIARNQDKLIFSSKYTCEVFEKAGVKCHFIPLGFDANNFQDTGKKYFNDGRITFNLCGKFEKRKHHVKIIKAWLKEFGDNNKYFLQCSLYNNFLKQEVNNSLVMNALEGQRHSNISFLNYMEKNSTYNDYLNSSSIIIGMSGGEGWGLPEFHSVGLGKHAVILNAHGYKSWADEKNSVLVEPSGKIDVYDDMFFKQGQAFNQGQIFDWKEEDFIKGCYEAIERVKTSPVNEEGKMLQKTFSYEGMTDKLLNLF